MHRAAESKTVDLEERIPDRAELCNQTRFRAIFDVCPSFSRPHALILVIERYVILAASLVYAMLSGLVPSYKLTAYNAMTTSLAASSPRHQLDRVDDEGATWRGSASWKVP